MIIDDVDSSQQSDMSAQKTPTESPPAYSSTDYSLVAVPVVPETPQHKQPAVLGNQLVPTMPPTTVYHYVHPMTNDHVASLLPPDHPEMICLQEGRHLAQTKFGILGLLAAVFWFPLGIGLCMLDRKVQCRRCGQAIDDGICG